LKYIYKNFINFLFMILNLLLVNINKFLIIYEMDQNDKLLVVMIGLPAVGKVII